MPKVLKVGATDPGKVKGEQVRKPSSATIEIQTGETAKEAIEMFGDEAVLTNANANWVVTVQGGIRRMLVAGSSQEDIQKAVGDTKMGVSRVKSADHTVAIKKQWANWSPEQRAQFIKDLKAAE